MYYDHVIKETFYLVMIVSYERFLILILTIFQNKYLSTQSHN